MDSCWDEEILTPIEFFDHSDRVLVFLGQFTTNDDNLLNNRFGKILMIPRKKVMSRVILSKRESWCQHFLVEQFASCP